MVSIDPNIPASPFANLQSPTVANNLHPGIGELFKAQMGSSASPVQRGTVSAPTSPKNLKEAVDALSAAYLHYDNSKIDELVKKNKMRDIAEMIDSMHNKSIQDQSFVSLLEKEQTQVRAEINQLQYASRGEVRSARERLAEFSPEYKSALIDAKTCYDLACPKEEFYKTETAKKFQQCERSLGIFMDYARCGIF